MVEGPGVTDSQLFIACYICGAQGEATITAIFDDLEDEDDD
jgi:hypothetical protein